MTNILKIIHLTHLIRVLFIRKYWDNFKIFEKDYKEPSHKFG